MAANFIFIILSDRYDRVVMWQPTVYQQKGDIFVLDKVISCKDVCRVLGISNRILSQHVRSLPIFGLAGKYIATRGLSIAGLGHKRVLK
jgi:hypothetical protein